MPETMIPLGNKPWVTPFTSVGKETCKNLYLEYSGSATAKAEYFMIRIPGHGVFSTFQAGLPRCRGMYCSTTGILFSVNSNKVQKIDAEGYGVNIGTLNTISGTSYVSMCDNGSELLIVDGKDGWIYSFALGTFERITDEAFPGVVSGIGPTHCVCIDTYFIVNDPGTTKYFWSQPAYVPDGDGTLWSGLDFGQKLGMPEPIIALANCQNMVWLFGARSIEVHYDTGDFANGVWQRYQGAMIQMGAVAKFSIATYGNSVFWLGSDSTGAVGVWTNDGFQPKRISTRGVEQIFQLLGDLAGTVGFTYSMNGHTFYVLQLPGRCFVYDVTTDAWHERTYLSPINGVESAWRCNFTAFAYGKNCFGMTDGGGVVYLDQELHRNRDPLNGQYDAIRWEKTSPISFALGKRVVYHWYQPIFQQGVGLIDNLENGTGKNPVCWLSWSDDSGMTYGNLHSLEMGAMGEYGKRSRKSVCGMSRNRVVKISGSEPVLTILVGLLANAEVRT